MPLARAIGRPTRRVKFEDQNWCEGVRNVKEGIKRMAQGSVLSRNVLTKNNRAERTGSQSEFEE